MNEDYEKYTPHFMTVLQQEKNIPGFFDALFGFLRCRTDFYHILSEENRKTGFPPGKAKQMVLEAFTKHQKIATRMKPTVKPAAAAQSTSTRVQGPSSSAVSKVESMVKPRNTADASTSPDAVILPEPRPLSSDDQGDAGMNASNTTTGEHVYVADPDQYNGASFEHYSWSQTITDLDVRVEIPEHVQTSKQLKLSIGGKSIDVKCAPPEGDVWLEVFKGTLKWNVKHHEAMWVFHPKDHQVHINVDKVEERWWDGLIEGETALDTRRIDCSRPMEDLDDEAQAKIQELMYDQQQKRLGKPGIQQQKMEGLLKKAFHAEGSPFAGQEFDPSLFNLDGNSGGLSL